MPARSDLITKPKRGKVQPHAIYVETTVRKEPKTLCNAIPTKKNEALTKKELIKSMTELTIYHKSRDKKSQLCQTHHKDDTRRRRSKRIAIVKSKKKAIAKVKSAMKEKADLEKRHAAQAKKRNERFLARVKAAKPTHLGQQEALADKLMHMGPVSQKKSTKKK